MFEKDFVAPLERLKQVEKYYREKAEEYANYVIGYKKAIEENKKIAEDYLSYAEQYRIFIENLPT
jgi:hypothetical protein